MMKRFLLLLTIFTLSIIVIGCNDTEDPEADGEIVNNQGENKQNKDDDHSDDNDAMIDSSQTGKIQEDMDQLNYVKFELEIEYKDFKEYEAKIEQYENGIKATLDDELTGKEVKGEEAFNIIYPIVKKLDIDQQTSKEEAIKQIIDNFELDPNYNEFELELTFKDHTKIEFKDKQ